MDRLPFLPYDHARAFAYVVLVHTVACAPTPASVSFEGDAIVVAHSRELLPVQKATVLDADGKALEPQPTLSWTVTPEQVAKLEGAFIRPLESGVATVEARVGEVKGTYKVEVAFLPVIPPIDPAARGVLMRQVVPDGATPAGQKKYKLSGNADWCAGIMARADESEGHSCVSSPRANLDLLIDKAGLTYSLEDCTGSGTGLHGQVAPAEDMADWVIDIPFAARTGDLLSLGQLGRWFPTVSFAGTDRPTDRLLVAVGDPQHVRLDPLPSVLVQTLATSKEGTKAWSSAERCRRTLCEEGSRMVEQYTTGYPLLQALMARTAELLVDSPSTPVWTRTSYAMSDGSKRLRWVVVPSQRLILSRGLSDGYSAAKAANICGASYCGDAGQVRCAGDKACNDGLISQRGRCTQPGDDSAYLKDATDNFAVIAWLQSSPPTKHRVAVRQGPAAPKDCASGQVVPETEIGFDREVVIQPLLPDTQYQVRVCEVGDQGATSSGKVVPVKTLQSSEALPCAINDWGCLAKVQGEWALGCVGSQAPDCLDMVTCRTARLKARWQLQETRAECVQRGQSRRDCDGDLSVEVQALAQPAIDAPCETSVSVTADHPAGVAADLPPPVQQQSPSEE